jgi:hypothetical protein
MSNDRRLDGFNDNRHRWRPEEVPIVASVDFALAVRASRQFWFGAAMITLLATVLPLVMLRWQLPTKNFWLAVSAGS